MAGIFISYRRKDSAEAAQLIYNRLDARFPRVPVFIDVDEIPPGRDFRTTIDDTLRRCTAVLAVIGPDWVDSRDAAGNRRLDNPADFVRLELESAFRGRVTVIVVLVRGARLPDVHQLPPSLEGLSRCPTCISCRRAWRVSVAAPPSRSVRFPRPTPTSSALCR